MPTALASLTDDIVALSQEDLDLLCRDFESAKKYCFHKHCERVWLKLPTEKRDAIRDIVREDGPVALSTALYIDYSCIEEIGRLIADAGCYPFSDGVHGVPVVDSVK